MSFLKEQTYINPHLKLHILNQEERSKIYANEDPSVVTLQRVDFMSKTRMFDNLLNEVAQLPNMSFPTLKDKLQKNKLKNEEEKKSLNESNVKSILKDLKQRTLNDEDSEEIDVGQMNVYKLAKIYFDEGRYPESHDLLAELEKQGLKDFLWIRTPWARLYNQVIMRREDAKKTFETVRKRFDEIESEEYKAASKNKNLIAKVVKQNYAQKEQYLSLAAVVFFGNKTKDEDFEKYVDICNEKSNFSVMQLLCPHLLRYLTVATIVNKNLHKNRNHLFDLYKLTEIVKRGIVKYEDPFTNFIKNLYINFDFESAAENIAEIQEAIRKDVLLLPTQGRIIEGCNFLYYKVYCKIYESLSISEIAKFIKKSEIDAELWILKYIRSSDIEAKIDSVEGRVISMRNRENRAEKYVNAIPEVSTLITTMTHSDVQQE